jgi:2-polyprenyl-6-methoxyphenol hydroxylase-like FAD-dependent oxidoreductase
MKAIVIGASIAGASSALALDNRGWDVTVLESDDTPSPDRYERDTYWTRRGIPHAMQAHGFGGGFLEKVKREATDAYEEMMGSRPNILTMQELASPALDPLKPRPGDEIMRGMGARRPMVEWALRRAVERRDKIVRREGAHVQGLLTETASPARVSGVRLSDGQTLTADVVIDASGRRSRAPAWLADIGVKLPPERIGPCGMVYWGRHYLLKTEEKIPIRGGAALVTPFATFVVLLFPGDHGTLQLAMGSLPRDPMFAQGLRPEVFHAIASQAPNIAPWISPDRADPASEVFVYGGLQNRAQPLVAAEAPVVTGFHRVGDAAAITNPNFGRGAGHAATYAAQVAEIVTAEQDPIKQSLLIHDEFNRSLVPSVEESIWMDQERIGHWQRSLDGDVHLAPLTPPLPQGVSSAQYMHLLRSDPDFWRAVMRGVQLLQPPGSWRNEPAWAERLRAVEAPDLELPSPEDVRATMARVEAAIAAA